MRKIVRLKRTVSILLLIAMLLSLCGCGGRDNLGDDPASGGATAAPVAVAGEDAALGGDATIQAHIQHNKDLVPKDLDRPADTFQLYIANTDTMAGFVSDRKVTAFQDGIQSAFDVASSQFGEITANYLEYPEGSNTLQWFREPLNEYLLRSIQSPDFYEDKPLPTTGPLSSMFGQADGPFYENGLTLIVSNFAEPGFDLNSLAAGIEAYFDEYEASAACIIGMSTPYSGNLKVPHHTKSKEDTTFYIKNYDGEAPCYMVVVGPETAVRSYTDTLYTYLDSRGIRCSSSLYTNSVHKQLIAPALSFDVVPDAKAKKLTPSALSSYNTGKLTEHEAGNVYFTTFSSVETLDTGAMEPGSVRVSRSTQVALVSSNFDKASAYDYSYQLFIYDDQTQQWVDAGKNPTAMASVTLMPLSYQDLDPENDPISILAEGREEMYLGARLNFEDAGIMSRDSVYRLEVQIRLNRDNPDAQSESLGSNLTSFSVGSSDYYNMISGLCGLEDGNFTWTGPKKTPERMVRAVLECTPNLDAFLVRLQQLEDKYKSSDEYIQYVDILFNTPDKDAKR